MAILLVIVELILSLNSGCQTARSFKSIMFPVSLSSQLDEV